MKFTSLQQIERVRDECKSMVTKRAGVSAGAAAVPVPGLDIGTDVALLLEMLPAINKRFGLSAEDLDNDPTIKRLVLVTATSIGSEIIGRTVTKQIVVQLLKRVGISVASKSVSKYIPLLGQALAAGVSFGAMKYVGNGHVDDCFRVACEVFKAKKADSGRELG